MSDMTLPPFIRIGDSRLRHGNHVASIAFSPTGDLILSGAFDEALCCWNAKTGQLVWRSNEALARSHDRSSVHSVSFHPTGRYLAYVTPHDSVRIKDTEDWRLFSSLRDIGPVRMVAFAPNGALLACGLYDGTLCVWDLWGRAPLSFIDVGAVPQSLAFASQGEELLVVADGGLQLYDVATSALLANYHDPISPIVAADVAIRGTVLVIGKADGTVAAVVSDGMSPAGLFSGSGNKVAALLAHPLSPVIAVGRDDLTVDIVELRHMSLLHRIVPAGAPVAHCFISALAYSADGSRFAYGGSDRVVHVCSGKTYEELMPGPTHILGPKCLYIGREGEELLTASGDGRIQTWDLRQGPLRARVSTGVADVIRAEFSDGGKYVAVLSAASECVLCRLGLGRGEEFARVCREDVDISAMALAHGTYVTCTREGRMRVWDVGSMALLSDLHVGTDVICVGVASQRRVIVGGWEGRFSILDLTRGETKQMQLRNHVAALSLPGRGDLTAVRDMEGLQVWDIRELRRTVDLPGHYSAFALAENGASVAVGSEDKVKMVDSLSGECIRDLTGLVGCAEVVVYGHHDTMVAAGNSESQVLVWKV